MKTFTLGIATSCFFPLFLWAETSAIETQSAPPITVWGKKRIKNLPSEASEFEGESFPISDRPQNSWSRLLENSPSLITNQPGGESVPPVFLIRGQAAVQTRYFL